ncbi:hypothetical protein ALC57_02237, partial [Trachymyrmex cornetzi]
LTIAHINTSNSHTLFFQSLPNLLFPVHLTAPASSLPKNLIILDFSLFNSKPFLSIYPSNLSNILLILPSSSASNTTSSAYAKLYTFPSPNFTPPHLTLPISSSRSAITKLNSRGLSGPLSYPPRRPETFPYFSPSHSHPTLRFSQNFIHPFHQPFPYSPQP